MVATILSNQISKKEITVLDVVTDILNELNITYQLENDGFVLNQGRQL